MKMQFESVENITLFLKNENWNFDGLSQNKKINYNSITFFYDNLIFKNINENVLQIYFCKNKSNFILVKTNFNCFTNFLKNFNFEKRKTLIFKDNISTVLYSNGTIFEFLEIKGIYIDNIYYILVYNSNYSISNIEKNRLIKELDNIKYTSNNKDLFLRNKTESSFKPPDDGIATSKSLNSYNSSTPVTWVEQMPEFPGGEKAMTDYIQKHFRVSDAARESGQDMARVTVRFIVDSDGSISDVKLVRGVGYGLDEEALRLVRSFPKWKAGKQNGKVVPVIFTLPINISLN